MARREDGGCADLRKAGVGWSVVGEKASPDVRTLLSLPQPHQEVGFAFSLTKRGRKMKAH